jgi:hypothetical protein
MRPSKRRWTSLASGRGHEPRVEGAARLLRVPGQRNRVPSPEGAVARLGDNSRAVIWQRNPRRARTTARSASATVAPNRSSPRARFFFSIPEQIDEPAGKSRLDAGRPP